MKRIKYKSYPEDFFFHPGVDPGLSLRAAPDWTWRVVDRSRIVGTSVSEFDEIERKITSHINVTERLKSFSKVIVFNTLPALIEKASFVKSSVAIGNKLLLNGASGTRLRNKYSGENLAENPDIDADLSDFFGSQQARGAPLPVGDWPEGWEDLPFAIECRNTFNFFHFVTETLCQLCSVFDLPGYCGDIFIHYPNTEARAFTRDFVDALFPEIAERVKFERAPKSYDKALTAYNLRHAYYQTGPEVMPSLDEYAPGGWMWQGRKAVRTSMGLLAQNAIDANLLRLRKRALLAVEGGDFDHLPRRFWVGRSDEGARDRQMGGEAALVKKLEGLGFETVQFEELRPLEQVAIMARADVMIGYHGAGFANMVFASEKAHVIELGTLQTAMFRWGDFMPHAHAAGCTYLSFFGDHKIKDPLREPVFRKDGIVPVSLSERGADGVVAFIATLTGGRVAAADKLLVKTLRLLDQTGQGERVRYLLETNAGSVEKNADLSRLKAEILLEDGRLEPALEAMEHAFALAPSRYLLLQRLFWIAHRSDRTDKVVEVLAEYKARFPRKYAAFRKTLGWYKSAPLP